MNVSWDDVRNVPEAGDYPFRDGMLTVTFAEIAIWKKHPETLFQLMRKHPIRTNPEYVLGRIADEKAASVSEKLFYESSNGDSWSLTRDPVTGTRAIFHRPNPQSGGRASHVDLLAFLLNNANGPEHQALKQLLDKSSSAPTILIAYDIHPPRGPTYEAVIAAIQSLGAWWHHLETVWLVRCARTPIEVRDLLMPFFGLDDQLLVIDISGDAAGWAGVSDFGSKWLNENI